MVFKVNPALEAQVTLRLGRVLDAGAEGAAELLRFNLSAGTSERTGRKYAKHPRRSSAPGEWPQEQSSDLINDTGWAVISPLSRAVGFLGDDAEKYMDLEQLRSPIERTITSGETLAAIREAMRTA